MSEPSAGSTVDTTVTSSSALAADDDLRSVAESEIPEIRRQAREWLLANNASDQRAIGAFAAVIVVFALVLQSWWAGVLALCILLVLPFRWIAGPYFRRGDLRRGIMWANLGSWYLVFPLVAIIPETLPIAIQNVIGPVILAATYLDRSVVRRIVPGTILIAIAVSAIGLTTDGVGLDEVTPRWVFVTVILGYVGANLMLVMGDIHELNQVHLRSLRRAVRQNRELRAADRALRESRRRLLVAADAERVRLERDLHDGAQQRLVSLSLQLRLAAELIEEGRAPTSSSLMSLHHEASEAVDELRDLAQGVYPARLQELGLARALHAVARRSPLRIDIVDSTPGAIDPSTQVALYFVCVEAIQNATKHAGPDATITISLAADGDDLVVTVADDGPGFDAESLAGSRGLLNMDDRVGALGGELTIDTSPGIGTVVTARLPRTLQAAAEVSA